MGREIEKCLGNVIGKGEQRDRRLGGKLGRGTAKQKFSERNWVRETESQKVEGRLERGTAKQKLRECNFGKGKQRDRRLGG